MTKRFERNAARFWNSVLMQLKQLNPKSTICLTGGEPLLFDGFGNLQKTSGRTASDFLLITNGTLAKPDDVPRFKSLFHNIKISLDSLDENINSVTRGSGVLKKTKLFLDRLIAENVKPTVMVVVTKENAHRLSEFRTVFGDKVSMTSSPCT